MPVASPYTLKPEQIMHYRDNGYLAIEGMIASYEIQRLRDETLRFCRGAYHVPGIETADDLETDAEALEKYLCIHHPHKVSAVIDEFIRHPGIVTVLNRLVGPNIKCMQSM